MAGRRVGTMAGRGGSALAQRVMAIPMMAPLLVLALAVLPKVAEGTIEGFEAADTNKDGVLDKGEFAGFAQHIQSELSELMDHDCYCNAEETVKLGLADQVAGRGHFFSPAVEEERTPKEAAAPKASEEP